MDSFKVPQKFNNVFCGFAFEQLPPYNFTMKYLPYMHFSGALHLSIIEIFLYNLVMDSLINHSVDLLNSYLSCLSHALCVDGNNEGETTEKLASWFRTIS